MASIVEIGALTFHRLGRDDDAFKLARFAITHEGTIKKTIVSSCHLILAKVAAKRGNRDEADGHFASALEEANLSRLPMLELLAARDWKKHLLEPNGRDCSKAERKRSMLRALKQRRRGGGYVVGVVVGVEDQGSGIFPTRCLFYISFRFSPFKIHLFHREIYNFLLSFFILLVLGSSSRKAEKNS